MNLCRFIIASPSRAAKPLVTAMDGKVKNRPHTSAVREGSHGVRMLTGLSMVMRRRAGRIVSF